MNRTVCEYCTTWKLRLNTHTTDTILFSKRCSPPLPVLVQIQDTFLPWASAVRYLGLERDSKLLFTRHLHIVTHKATDVFCYIPPHPHPPTPTRDSALTHSNKLTHYKLLIRSILTYAAPVCSSTRSSKYLRLQVIQSQCLRVIGNHPRRTPTSHLHYTLNIEPIPVIIHLLTA